MQPSGAAASCSRGEPSGRASERSDGRGVAQASRAEHVLRAERAPVTPTAGGSSPGRSRSWSPSSPPGNTSPGSRRSPGRPGSTGSTPSSSAGRRRSSSASLYLACRQVRLSIWAMALVHRAVHPLGLPGGRHHRASWPGLVLGRSERLAPRLLALHRGLQLAAAHRAGAPHHHDLRLRAPGQGGAGLEHRVLHRLLQHLPGRAQRGRRPHPLRPLPRRQ